MFDEDGADQALTAQARLLRPQAPKVGAWQGLWGAAASAVPAAINETALAFSALSTKPGNQYASVQQAYERGDISQEKADAKMRALGQGEEIAGEIDERLRDNVKYFTPDATTTGSASQIVHGFTKTVTKIVGYAATGGVPGMVSGLSADEGINESLRLQDSGGDPGTAAKAGLVRAGTTAVGTALPAAGATWMTTAALIAASGPGSFMADQAAIKYILENADYKAKAAEYDPFDLTGILLSTAASGVAGAAAHGLRARAATATARERSMLPEDNHALRVTDEVEAAARTMQTVHAMQEKALTPAHDLEGQMQHQGAMAQTMRQMENGEAVAVSDMLKATDADVAARMPPTDITGSFQHRLDTEYQALRKEYEALAGEDANSQGGRVINTDIARELSPHYRADRTRSADVHEPASAFTKRLYAEKLQEIPKGSTVLFTAGGTGAGKSSAVKGLKNDDAALVFDTNMSTFETAAQKVDQALAAGHNAEIIYVYRDPVEAMVKGSLPRAERMGRTVPIDNHISTHLGAYESIPRLMERYQGDKRVKVEIIDNSRGKGKQALVDFDELTPQAYNDLKGTLHENLDSEFKAGRISEATYTGSGGKPSRQADAGSPSSSLAQEEVTSPGKSSPELQAAQQALSDGELPVVTGFTPDGQPIVRSASELLDEAVATEKQAQTDSKAFKAAVLCHLGKSE